MSVQSMRRAIAINQEMMNIECQCVCWVLRECQSDSFLAIVVPQRFCWSREIQIATWFLCRTKLCCLWCSHWSNGDACDHCLCACVMYWMGCVHHNVGVQYPQCVFISASDVVVRRHPSLFAGVHVGLGWVVVAKDASSKKHPREINQPLFLALLPLIWPLCRFNFITPCLSNVLTAPSHLVCLKNRPPTGITKCLWSCFWCVHQSWFLLGKWMWNNPIHISIYLFAL